MAQTLAQLRQRVRANLQEPDEDGRFSSTILNGFINEACFEIADRLDVLVREIDIDVEAENAEVRLPDRALGARRLRWNNRKINETTPEYLDTKYPGVDWTTLQGPPQFYYTNGPNIVRLFPIPDTTGVLAIRYVAAPIPLENDEDESELPDFLTDLVPLFATYRAHLSDVDGERKAAPWLQLFEGRIVQAQMILARRTSVPKGIRIRTEIRR